MPMRKVTSCLEIAAGAALPTDAPRTILTIGADNSSAARNATFGLAIRAAARADPGNRLGDAGLVRARRQQCAQHWKKAMKALERHGAEVDQATHEDGLGFSDPGTQARVAPTRETLAKDAASILMSGQKRHARGRGDQHP